MNKTALVTGGARRLGKYITLALAENGFDIILHYHSSGDEAEKVRKQILKLGRKCFLVRADVGKSAEIKKMFQKMKKHFRQIDVVINNAATIERANLEQTTEQLWDRILSVNLKSVFLISQEAAKWMRKQNNGMILNIASLGGIQAWKEHLAYSVSKAGVIHLTKILAKELAPAISVNAIAPGTIEMSDTDNRTKNIKPSSIPMKRFGKPEEICSLVVFLATKSRYTTGQVFAIDGGKSIL
ncbi:MAG: SDR family oxidoreductase [Ignavibacteriales bacterium]|nr:SDR family oxidoreductase [Ignavibacteriales bacterium]